LVSETTLITSGSSGNPGCCRLRCHGEGGGGVLVSGSVTLLHK